MANTTNPNQVTTTQAGSSSTLQAAQSQLTQIIGKLVENTGSQSGDLVSAINAVADAINAKPSA